MMSYFKGRNFLKMRKEMKNPKIEGRKLRAREENERDE